MAVEPGMNARPGAGAPPPVWAITLLWTIVIFSAVFLPLVMIVPLDAYRLVGNMAEVLSALFCMVCCLYAYRFLSNRIILPLAAFAFFSYALSNIFWYLYSITLGRASVYTSVSEIGFFCVFLFFIAAIKTGFPEKEIPVALSVLLMLVLFFLPLLVLWGCCAGQPLHLLFTLLRFLLVEQLIETTLRHGIFRYPLLGAGIVLFCMGEMVYGIRETIVLNSQVVFLAGPVPGSQISAYDLLSIAGPVSICSFALIMLGMFSCIRQGLPEEPASCRDAGAPPA
jgi:hypothetical protein